MEPGFYSLSAPHHCLDPRHLKNNTRTSSLHHTHLPRTRTGGKNAWFQPFVHAQNFPRNLVNRVILIFFCQYNMHNRVILVFFRVVATCSDRDGEFSSALALRISYTDKGYSMWKPWIYDHVVIVLLFTPRWCAMTLIANNKYGYITMQNNEAMKRGYAWANGWNQAFFPPPVNYSRVNNYYEATHTHAHNLSWLL